MTHITENRRQTIVRYNRRKMAELRESPLKYRAYLRTLKKRVAEWRKRNPDKVRAHRAVFVAIRNGTLKKRPCHCGRKKVEAHHADYRKPLKVVWLCKEHHRSADAKRRLSTPST